MAFWPPPGQFPGQPPGPQQFSPPSFPPPTFIPQQPAPFAVDPGAIAGCRFRMTYVWLVNRDQFWFFPVFIGPRSIAGFRWTGRFWRYTGFDLRLIISFSCF
ncbi:transporter [Brevibacillus sp. B_LB10_24]|uniref:transporter n=1 Tax=Brevibacillus sp. B_LB10_24 TaxID=3380645 RepID=UPI0038BA4553